MMKFEIKNLQMTYSFSQVFFFFNFLPVFIPWDHLHEKEFH